MIGSRVGACPSPPVFHQGTRFMSTFQDDLGSLAQASRSKALGQTRAILIGIGILTVLVNGFQFAMAEGLVKSEIEKEVQKLLQQGMVADPAQVKELEDASVRTVRLLRGGLVALGALFIVFGVVVKRFPVPITVVSLVLYVGTAAVFAVLDPSSVAKGLVMKVIVVVLLAKSIQTAIAYQREQQAAEGAAYRMES